MSKVPDEFLPCAYREVLVARLSLATGLSHLALRVARLRGAHGGAT